MKFARFILVFVLLATNPLFAMSIPYLLEVVKANEPKAATEELIKIFDNLARTALQLRPTQKQLEDLINRGANININATNKQGRSLLELAVTNGYHEGVKILLAHGANPNATNLVKAPVLFIAIQHGFPEIVRLLLDKGADPNFIHGGHTPLLSTITSPPIIQARQAIIKHLLAHGANVNDITIKGATPLTVAIMILSSSFNPPAEQSIILTLLNAGADPNIDSPLNLAINFIPSPTLIALLLQAGADPNLSFEGKTPLQFAQEKLSRAPEQDINTYKTIIELLKDPTKIKRAGLEKLTSEKYKIIEPILKGK